MRNMMILAGAAALAITAPALAKPGNGGGNGGGGNGGGGGPAKIERGGGGGGQQARGGGGGPRAERGGGQQRVRGSDRREVRAERRVERGNVRAERPVREARVNRGADRREARADMRRASDLRGNRAERIRDVQVDRRLAVRDGRSDVSFDRRGDINLFASQGFRTTGLVDGCPPGLAAKGNGCLPPGQARKLVGAVLPAALGSALLPPLYRNWYPDTDDYLYRTGDGYVYRIDRDDNLVNGFWPLSTSWDNSYYVGAAYPQEYLGYYNVPTQYQSWYPDNDDYYYRYGDGAIYQVDRGDGVIDGIVSLLAGGFGVGQPLPAGYDVYNVPYAYRDRYVDSADSLYRYNDGYIYEVDPTTRIVQAIVETLI